MDKPKEAIKDLQILMENAEKSGTIEIHKYQLDSIKSVLEYCQSNENPMTAYFNLETWLYEQEKSIEIKSAMIWGGLWVISKMGCIDWNAMREMYGEFMSKHMDLR